MKGFQSFAANLAKVFNEIAGWAVAAAMCVVVLNVLLRVIFKSPIIGSSEYTSFFTAIAIAFGIGYCALTGNHIAIDFLVNKLGGHTRKAIRIITDSVSFLCTSFCTWRIFVYANALVRSGEVAPTTRFPHYVFVYMTAIGFVVLCLVILAGLVADISGGDEA